MRTFLPKRLIGLAFLACGLSAPAFATEWATCASSDGKVNIALLMGSLDMASISGITLQLGNEQWSSSSAYGPGAGIAIGQTFSDDSSLLLDLVDDDFTVLANLRIFKATEGDTVAAAGILRLPGKGAWSVTCDELL